MKKYVVYFVIAMLGGLVALGANSAFKKHNYAQIGVSDESAILHKTSLPYGTSASATPPDFIAAANTSIHAVVHIKVEYKSKTNNNRDGKDIFGFEDFFGDFFGRSPMMPSAAAGSGVIISADGYIVTNNHVVENADNVDVTLNDKRSFKATIIGTDEQSDLAVIKIDAKDLPYLPYGDSDAIQVGEWVLAVGNPFNLTSTVTAGIVSAKARNFASGDMNGQNAKVAAFIQTDAAVNRGNSGGALVNTKGELIGINNMIASPNGSYSGYSFAIPSNTVKKVVNDLIKYKQVQRAYIGVSIRDIDSNFAKDKNIKELGGVYVADVTDNGAAKSAGIKTGDIITHINSVSVNNTGELTEQISRYRPGDKIKVSIKRSGSVKDYEIVLKNQDGNVNVVKYNEVDAIMPKLGAKFQKADASLLKKLGLSNGVQIIELQRGLISDAGINEGFIITEIDRTPIKSIDDIKSAISGKKDGILITGYYPNRVKAYYGVGLN